MSNWKSFFKAAQKKPSTQINRSKLEVNLQELIAFRYQSSGLDFSSAFSNIKKAHSSLSGGYRSPFKGRGLDFDEVRPYQPGDDIRNIDWNVTARSNRVHTKIFKEERERPVFLLVDFRDSMLFATRGHLKSVQAARFAALSAWIAADDHNRIGGVIFSEQEQYELRPQGGHKGVLKFFNQLSKIHQERLNPDRNSQNNKIFEPMFLFKRLKKVIKPGSLIIFISDFSFLDEENLHQMHYLAKHNDFIATFIYDVMEMELPPPGSYAITADNDPEHKIIQLDTRDMGYRNEYRHHFIQRDKFLLNTFNQIGAHFLRLASNEDPVQVMTQFLGHGIKKARVAKNRF